MEPPANTPLDPLQPTEPVLYAIVAVFISLARARTKPIDDPHETAPTDHYDRVFHYGVPDGMRDDIGVGQLVWVPFGARYLQGVVVGMADTSPVEETRDIGQIVDLEPVLSPERVDLARWMSGYYLTPLSGVIMGMLPPGIVQGIDTVLSLVPEADPEPNTDAQREMLALLEAKGSQTLQQIRDAVERKNWRSVANQLVRHGWAIKSVRVRPPKARPKLVKVVRLAPGVRDASVLSDRATRQRQAMDFFSSLGDGGASWRALSDVAREADVSTAVLRALVDKGMLQVSERQVWRDPLAGKEFVPVVPPPLTPHQAKVWDVVRGDLDQPTGKPFLLHGVTGSGKTEIYLRAVAHVLAQGRGAIALVPEIALTPQTVRRFGARFPSDLAVMHSHLSLGERYDQWRRIRAGDLRVVVGSRSAVFAPVSDLGLIVLDEEHEWSYKQDRMPRYHARAVAVQLASRVGATCILGSATPDLETAYRAERGVYTRIEMPRRIMGHREVVRGQMASLGGHRASAGVPEHFRSTDDDQGGVAMYADLPPVQITDLRAELRSGNASIFGHALREAITVALAAGEQVILFLNRRGAATFVQCRDCGYVCECPRCELPLTYHSSEDDLVCHHCNYRTFVPPQCPSCWSGRIRYFGIGTQRVEELTREAFPQARIVRWDLDTTGGKMAHEQLLDQFIRGEADIMVGTQMIAKGLDLPRVTLVGVITADTMLNLPDFRSSERTFQLLTQVAGRAGRSVLGGKVIIQTYTPQHPAIQAARQHDYEGFYRREIAFRRERWYPPISQLAHLLYVHPNAQHAQVEAERLHRTLVLKIARLGIPDVDLLGPAPAFFARLRGKSRWQIIVRGKDPGVLLRDMYLPLGWRVDVDPVSLL